MHRPEAQYCNCSVFSRSLSLSLCLSFSLPPVASRSRGSSSARQRIVTIQAAILGFGFGLCGHVGVIIQRQVLLRLSGVRVQGFRVFGAHTFGSLEGSYSGASPAAMDAQKGSERGSLKLETPVLHTNDQNQVKAPNPELNSQAQNLQILNSSEADGITKASCPVFTPASSKETPASPKKRHMKPFLIQGPGKVRVYRGLHN